MWYHYCFIGCIPEYTTTKWQWIFSLFPLWLIFPDVDARILCIGRRNHPVARLFQGGKMLLPYCIFMHAASTDHVLCFSSSKLSQGFAMDLSYNCAPHSFRTGCLRRVPMPRTEVGFPEVLTKIYWRFLNKSTSDLRIKLRSYSIHIIKLRFDLILTSRCIIAIQRCIKANS